MVRCLRAGDQVILVDDGSSDDTEGVVQEFVDSGALSSEVTWSPIWLGTNTIGGVGIAANIGIDHAECTTIFFVDGDDYMIPEGFGRARDAYEKSPTEICIANYLEYDQQRRNTRVPADAGKWRHLMQPLSLEARRHAAIDLIAVPWRKFYQTEFLRRYRLRFPEGDFFFEDNPFHWRVCLKAQSISFMDEIVCHHRINRPGQTMGSTGVELTAFFTHYNTIASEIPTGRRDLQVQAVRWLINQMSWHIPRLAVEATYAYARCASEVLQKISDPVWQAVEGEMIDTMAWRSAARLRDGEIHAVVDAWLSAASRALQRQLKQDIESLAHRMTRVEKRLQHSCELLDARRALEEFMALKSLFDRVQS